MSRKTSLHAKFERQQTPANFGSKVAASSKPKKEKASKAGAIGGFGSGGKLPKGVKVVRDKATTRFLKELASKGGSSVAKTLKRAGLATFATQEYGLLRGVVATADVKKGEPIIEIPYEVAVDLGKEGMGVAEAGARLLKAEIWEEYEAMLPPQGSSDVLGSSDFWSDEDLAALHLPHVASETAARKASIIDYASSAGIPPSDLSHASWLVTSRCLTVEGEQDSGERKKLLIPFLDMCNHDRRSPHVLTGRAADGGVLKVLAGKDVKKGEQICIRYGGGGEGNDRFIQDYGFVDDCVEAFDIVAKDLSAACSDAGFGSLKASLGGGGGGRRTILKEEAERAVEMIEGGGGMEAGGGIVQRVNAGLKAAWERSTK